LLNRFQGTQNNRAVILCAQFNFGFEHARRAEYEIIGTKGGIKCHNVWAKQDETPVISWTTDSGEEHTEQLGKRHTGYTGY
jgi:hypothetical protein